MTILLAAGAALALGVTVGVSPRVAVEVCVAILALLLMLRSLLAGLVLFTVATFPNNLPHSLGAGATLAKPLGAVLIVSWLLALAGGREMPLLLRDAPVAAWTAIGLVAWGTLSVAWAPDPHVAASSAFRVLQVVLLFFIAYSAIRSHRDLAIAAGGFVLAASLTSAYALGSGQAVAGRLSGGIQNPNFLAANIVPAVAIAGFMLLARPRASLRAALVAAIVLNLVALAGTASRGALLALAAALLAGVVFAGRHRPKVLAATLVVVAIGIVYIAAEPPSTPTSRFTEISFQASNGRAALWHLALAVAADHPLSGVGLANFPIVEPRYFQNATGLDDPTGVVGRRNAQLVVHNTYLEVLAELGVVGLALFTGLLLTTTAAAVRRLRSLELTHAGSAAISRGVIVGTVGLLMNYLFDSGEFQKQLWLLVGLLAAIGCSRALGPPRNANHAAAAAPAQHF